MKPTIRIGTRGSKLALWQARWVQTALAKHWPDVHIELAIIKTKGDKILDVPLAKVGGKGLFVKEIEEALTGGRIDLAVHSMKDMPAELPPDLTIGAIPRRESPLDAFISRDYQSVESLPRGARVGTSSLRRSAQLLHQRPDLTIAPLRGNIDTRLNKLKTGDLDAIVLAAAGLQRLGLQASITTPLDKDFMLPAVGQGALCIETRDRDPDILPLVLPLEDTDSRSAVEAERAFLDRLEGGCQVPIAAHGTFKNNQLRLVGLVAELDGSRIIKSEVQGDRQNARTLGRRLAENLLGQGADIILQRLQSNAG